MTEGPVPLIRIETPRDFAPVRSVLETAFGGSAEADLVESLRADGDLVLGLVGETRDGIAGYVGFFRLALTVDGRSIPVTGLAPLGVRPDMQRNGIASALIRAGLARLTDRGETLVFVLGEPTYYARFGFAAMQGYSSPYEGPHFQVLHLAPTAPHSGIVTYPKSFAALG